jgi:hypothetical protein
MGLTGAEFASEVRNAAASGAGGAVGISADEYAQLANDYRGMNMLARYGAASSLAGDHQALVDALNRGMSYEQYAERAEVMGG